MKPKTKSELMAEWENQPYQLKKEREVKAVRKAMDDARAVIQDGLTRYVKKKTKSRSMLFEYDRQRREVEKQCEQLAMEGMMKK